VVRVLATYILKLDLKPTVPKIMFFFFNFTSLSCICWDDVSIYDSMDRPQTEFQSTGMSLTLYLKQTIRLNTSSTSTTWSKLTLQPSQVITPKWIPFPTSEQMAHNCWPSMISTWAGLTVHTIYKIHTPACAIISDFITDRLIWFYVLCNINAKTNEYLAN